MDLRAKAFSRIRQTVSDGKQVVQFQFKKLAEEKADEVERLVAEYGNKKLETFDLLLKADPLALQAKLTPFGKTISDAVDFYEAFLKEQADKENSQTLGVLADEWLADKKRRVKQNTMRQATYDTLYYKVHGNT